MLNPIERLLFVLLTLVSLALTVVTFRRMVRVILRGTGSLSFDGLLSRLASGVSAFLVQGKIWRRRPLASAAHLLLAWAFLFYGLVNLADLFSGFGVSVQLPGHALYRLVADGVSVAGLVAVSYLLVRRFAFRSADLRHSDAVTLHPAAVSGIPRDSLIVGAFILGHVGFRFLGQSVAIALEGPDPYQPLAGLIAPIWAGLPPSALSVFEHLCWWMAFGLILVFLPYFPYSKHAHLFMGPLNWMTRPRRRSPGALEPLDFEDQSIEQFGAARITDLSRTQLVDTFACIMCNRCQDVCPPYLTGKQLSPSALEINKRYRIRASTGSLASGGEDDAPLLGIAISESAVWSCLGCGACIEACPVGNEPMFDILDMRRDQVLMQSRFPAELRDAFTGIERSANPWQLSQDRLEWAQALDFPVPTVEGNPDFDVLYWVGCAGAFDADAQETARALATLLHQADVDFAVLGNAEACTGDMARRSGNEYLFSEMARANIETLNAAGAQEKTIVTACPHCLHTIGNEYPDFGGSYRIEHHTTYIRRLMEEGSLVLPDGISDRITYHDPCYLGRHSGEYSSPRQVLGGSGCSLLEMDRNRREAYCCGGGGAQVWKEEEGGDRSVSAERYAQARATGADVLAVGCPFCARMLKDAGAASGEGPEVRDIAVILSSSL